MKINLESRVFWFLFAVGYLAYIYIMFGFSNIISLIVPPIVFIAFGPRIGRFAVRYMVASKL